MWQFSGFVEEVPAKDVLQIPQSQANAVCGWLVIDFQFNVVCSVCAMESGSASKT